MSLSRTDLRLISVEGAVRDNLFTYFAIIFDGYLLEKSGGDRAKLLDAMRSIGMTDVAEILEGTDGD